MIETIYLPPTQGEQRENGWPGTNMGQNKDDRSDSRYMYFTYLFLCISMRGSAISDFSDPRADISLPVIPEYFQIFFQRAALASLDLSMPAGGRNTNVNNVTPSSEIDTDLNVNL